MTLKHLAAVAAVAALAVPTAATAEPGKSKGKSGKAKTEKKAKGHAKAKNAVFKGSVVSIDLATGTVTVDVDKANKWGRRFDEQEVAFTTAGVKKINVSDRNADGQRNLADVLVGDKVQAQAKITKEQEAPLAARKFKVYEPETEEAPEAEKQG